MINNPRKFAITWLLEPSKKETVQYEYVFRLVTYSSQECIVHAQNFIKIMTYQERESHDTRDLIYPSEFPIIQAKLYKKEASKKEYIGMVEYFGLACQEEYYYYNNHITSEEVEKTKYVYYLRSNLYDFAHKDIDERDLTYQVFHKEDGNLVWEQNTKQIERYSSTDIFTAEFYSFSAEAYCEYANKRINVYGMSYPDAEYQSKKYFIYPEQPTAEWSLTKAGAENTSFWFYPYYSKSLNDYQDFLFKPLDTKIPSAPLGLVKCSDGLDLDTFKSIASETKSFSENTIIIFEHE